MNGQEQSGSSGYHFNIDIGTLSTHKHVCDRCGVVYEHTHHIKDPRMQFLYNNWCQQCEKTTVRVVPDNFKTLECDKLIEQIKDVQSDMNKLQIMPNAHLWFHKVVGLVPAHEIENREKMVVLQKELKQLEIELQYRIQYNLRVNKMSTWDQFVGMKYMGLMGPISYYYPLGASHYYVKVSDSVVIVGEEAQDYYQRLHRGFSSVMDNIPLCMAYLDMLKAEHADIVSMDVDGVYREVLESLKSVLDRIINYIMRKLAMEGLEFIQLKHMHYTKTNGQKFIPIEIKRINDIRIYRSDDGYVAYKPVGSDCDERLLKQFCDNNPLNHLSWVKFDVSEATECDVELLLGEIEVSHRVLRRKTVYRKLVYALSSVEYKSDEYYQILNYLKLSHWYCYRERPSCRAYILSGPPGTGKSYDVKEITGTLSNVYFYSYDVKTKQYFDGYQGQPIMVVDDIGHHKPEEWLLLLKFITDIPYSLPMAQAQLKDSIPSTVEEIYLTTNCIDKLLALDKGTRDAICRRVDVLDYTHLHEAGKVQWQRYERQIGSFVTYYTSTREEMRSMFELHVASRRQLPYLENKQSKSWKYCDLVMQYLPLIRTEFTLISEFYNLLRCLMKVSVISKPLQAVEYAMCEFTKRLPKMVKLQEAVLKLTRKNVKYIKHEFKVADMTVLPPKLYDEVKAVAEGHVLSYEFSGKNGNIEKYGKCIACPDLSQYVHSEEYSVHVPRSVIPVPKFESNELLLFPELSTLTEQVVPEFNRVKTRHWFQDLPEPWSNLYKQGKQNATSTFAPLNREFIRVYDESEYKPNLPYKTVLNHKKCSEFFQGGKRAKTLKRRMERVRQKARR